MKVFALVGLVAMAVATAFPVKTQPAQTGLQQVEQHMRALTSMTARFVQSGPGTQNHSGRLSIKTPGKIRIEYQNGMLIVGDGQLNFVDPGAETVQSPLAESLLSVLIDPSVPTHRTAYVVTDDDSSLVVDFRDPSRPGLGRLTLVFAKDASAPGGLRLHGWTAVDARRDPTVVRLSDQRYNVPIADSVFIPAGTSPPVDATVMFRDICMEPVGIHANVVRAQNAAEHHGFRVRSNEGMGPNHIWMVKGVGRDSRLVKLQRFQPANGSPGIARCTVEFAIPLEEAVASFDLYLGQFSYNRLPYDGVNAARWRNAGYRSTLWVRSLRPGVSMNLEKEF